LTTGEAGGRTALFVTYGGGHIGMVLPVIAALKSMAPDLRCVLLALTTGYNKAMAAGASPLGYRDFTRFSDPAAVQRWGRQLHAGNTSPDVSEAESVAYLGLNYLDLIAQHGEEGAAELYARDGRYGFKPLHFMRRLFDEVRPDVVVATNSPRSEQAALEVAVERRIPSVGMVDLFGLDTDTYVMRAVKPDWTCVISSVVRDRLLARGFVPDGVQVTGNPAFDGLLDADNEQRAQQFLAALGWQGKQVILYAGAWEPLPHPATDIPPGRSFPIEVERLLRQYVSERPGTALVVRYHPGDWFEYPRHPADPQVHFSEPPSEPIHPLILASSVVVVTNSTVGLESAVGGKAVVSVENSPMVHVWFSLAKLGVAYPSPTHLDLPETLDRVLADPRPRPGYASDGQAGRRVAQVVLQAVEKSHLDANSRVATAGVPQRH
jgi:hypothetical protein